jgi:hypothetical protein
MAGRNDINNRSEQYVVRVTNLQTDDGRTFALIDRANAVCSMWIKIRLVIWLVVYEHDLIGFER